MRAAKNMRLEEPEHDNHDTHNQDAAGEDPFVSQTLEESPLAGPSTSNQPEDMTLHHDDSYDGDHSSLDDR